MRPWASPQRVSWVPLLCASLLAFALAACGVKVGDSCDSDYSCGDSRLVCDLTAPDGYCLGVDCWEDGDCTDDGVCVQFPNGERFCLLGCEDGGDCRDGYDCIDDLEGQPSFCYLR